MRITKSKSSVTVNTLHARWTDEECAAISSGRTQMRERERGAHDPRFISQAEDWR
jgi:hypothetical protein